MLTKVSRVIQFYEKTSIEFLVMNITSFSDTPSCSKCDNVACNPLSAFSGTLRLRERVLRSGIPLACKSPRIERWACCTDGRSLCLRSYPTIHIKRCLLWCWAPSIREAPVEVGHSNVTQIHADHRMKLQSKLGKRRKHHSRKSS